MGSKQEGHIVKLILDYKKDLFFSKGIDKYTSVSDFTLLAYDKQQPFFWLEGKIYKNLGFLLIDPYMVNESYNPIIEPKILDELYLGQLNEGLILCIANRNQTPKQELTVNLVNPILINWSSGLAEQAQIENSFDYSREYPIGKMDFAKIGD